MSNIVNLAEWKSKKEFHDDENKPFFLSEEQVRAYPQFKQASSEEILHIINSLHQLSLITYELISREINQEMKISKAA